VTLQIEFSNVNYFRVLMQFAASSSEFSLQAAVFIANEKHKLKFEL
jgi:hypothetical protein